MTFSMEVSQAEKLREILELTKREISQQYKYKCTLGKALYYLVNNGYNILLEEVKERKLKAIAREKKVKGKIIKEDKNSYITEEVSEEY